MIGFVFRHDQLTLIDLVWNWEQLSERLLGFHVLEKLMGKCGIWKKLKNGGTIFPVKCIQLNIGAGEGLQADLEEMHVRPILYWCEAHYLFVFI